MRRRWQVLAFQPESGAAGGRRERHHVICSADEVQPGRRRIVEIAGQRIGLFNVDGRFYALHNHCPHRGGPLCEGPVCGTTLPTDHYKFEYGREGELVRCAWHGWEFEIASGRALADPRIRARTYPVRVEDGRVVITL
jgi:nitrite reductase/ring-hydroxylating ferredoxin subunit